jgi:hypothetical protein
MRTLLLLCFLLFSCPGLQTQEAAPPAKEVKIELLTRVGVIGASVSAGSGHALTLARILDCAIKPPHRVVDEARLRLSANPVNYAEEAVRSMQRNRVTLAIGMDFLFWFSYGPYSFERRKANLAQGCRILEKLDCPLVIGDLPDLRHSKNPMRSLMAPTSDEVRHLNEQLEAWACKRSNVLILPVSEWLDKVIQGQPLRINGQDRKYSPVEIFLPDKVHTTPLGTIVLAMKVLNALAIHYNDLEKEHFLLDVQAIARAIQKKNRSARAPEKRKSE